MDFCAFLWIFFGWDFVLWGAFVNTNEDTRYEEMLTTMDIMSCLTMDGKKVYQTRMGMNTDMNLE